MQESCISSLKLAGEELRETHVHEIARRSPRGRQADKEFHGFCPPNLRCRNSPAMFFPLSRGFFFLTRSVFHPLHLPCHFCSMLDAICSILGPNPDHAACYLQHFGAGTFHFVCYLQHLGAGTSHVECYLQHFGAGTFYLACYVPHLGAGTFHLSCYLRHLGAGTCQFACYL